MSLGCLVCLLDMNLNDFSMYSRCGLQMLLIFDVLKPSSLESSTGSLNIL